MAHDKSTRDNAKLNSDSVNFSPEEDMAYLASILTQSQGHKREDADDSQLLGQLTAANGVAKGVEERLDGIIGNLDQLLAALEAESEERRSSEVAVLDKTKETPSS